MTGVQTCALPIFQLTLEKTNDSIQVAATWTSRQGSGMPGGQVGAACGEKAGGFSMIAEEFRVINRLRGGSLPVKYRWIWG